MSFSKAQRTLDATRDAPLFRALTLLAATLVGAILIWAAFDGRMLDDVHVWMKPLKFAASFVVLFGTLALIQPHLSEDIRRGWPLRIVGSVMATAFVAEMGYIIYQAAHAEPSHFNRDSAFHAFMYGVVMAAGAVALVASIAVFGWIVRRDTAAGLSPLMRQAIWLGFSMTFVLTMIVAGYLSSGTSHFVGLHPAGAPTLPLLGWSGVVGDLRPAHFASLHAMQALPIVALLLERFPSRRNTFVILWITGAAYSVLTLALFTQALLDFPLIAL